MLFQPLDALTVCKYNSSMIMELLGNKDYLRVLAAIRAKGSLRFSQIEKLLNLNPARVDRALKFLRKGLCIVPHTIATPTRGERVLVEYRLGKRGAASLEVLDGLAMSVQKRSRALGRSEVEELQQLAL